MKFIIAFVIVVLFISCNSFSENEIKNNISSITIIVKNKPDYFFINNRQVKMGKQLSYVNIDNPYYDKTIEKDTTIIHNIDKIILTYKTLNQNYHFFIQRDDTLVLTFNNKKNPKALLLNREDSLLNYDINKNIRYFDGDFVFFIKFGRLRNKKEEQDYYINELNSYSKEYKILDSVYQQTHNNEYKIRRNICKYKTKTFILANKVKLDEYEISYPKLSFDDLKKEEDLSLYSYQSYLNIYIKNKYEVKMIKQSNGSVLDTKSAFDYTIIDNSLSNATKDFLLYTYFKDIAENFSEKDFNIYFQKLSLYINNKNLLTKLDSEYLISEKKELYNKELVLLSSSRKKIELEELITSHKGKIIFVDFWASWCAPCLANINYIKKLESKYKDLVVLYISIDKNFDNWTNAVLKEKINPINSYLSVNYPYAKLYRDLNLKSIPRYIIYDKKGNLVELNVPSPREIELENIIKKYK